MLVSRNFPVTVFVYSCSSLLGCQSPIVNQEEQNFPKTSVSQINPRLDVLGNGKSKAEVAADFFNQLKILKNFAEEPLAESGSNIPVAQLIIDGKGQPRGIHVFAVDGLGKPNMNESPIDFVKRYISENTNLWGISNEIIKNENIEFSVRFNSESQSPNNRHVRHIQLLQHLDGIPVLDDELNAVLWDNTLTSLVGRIITKSDLPSTNAILSQTTVPVAQVESGLSQAGIPDGYMLSVADSGIHSQFGYVTRFIAFAGPTAFTSEDTFQVIANTNTGEIVYVNSRTQNYPIQGGKYKVYKPLSTSSNPQAQVVATVDAFVSLDYSFATDYVYPWSDGVPAILSPVPTYNGTFNWGGGVIGFPVNIITGQPSDYEFLWNPGSANFYSQHASYWGQRAMATADTNFAWWPPSNPSYKYQRVTIVTDVTGQGQFNSDGCWSYNVWRSMDGDSGQNPKVGCVRAPIESNYPNATKIDTIFHEFGHAIDWKYQGGNMRVDIPHPPPCDPNTSEEAESLGETIAALYSMMMMLQEFSGSFAFTDYDAINGTLNGLGQNAFEAFVHTDDDDVVCHAPHNPGGGPAPWKTWHPGPSPNPWDQMCDDPTWSPGKYRYGVPLLQAYWESAHGRDCDGNPGDACQIFTDIATPIHAKWALFYAMKVTPQAGTYRDFVANFLSYYFYDVHQDSWNNRWWVFNHHRLVGPPPLYSPCGI